MTTLCPLPAPLSPVPPGAAAPTGAAPTGAAPTATGRASIARRAPATRRHRLRGLVPRAAVVLAVAVAASSLAAPTPASADPLGDARSAISASVEHRTLPQDVVSGRITVDQIVDVVLATGTASPSSRAALTRQATEEVEDLRAGMAAGEAPGLEDGPGRRGTPDPVTADAHWWSKVFHWKTFAVPSRGFVAGVAASAVVLLSIGATCVGHGAVVCAAVSAMSAGASAFIATTATYCVHEGRRFVYVKVPDFWNSHCGD
ncbi:hypothetical protein C5B94_09335 [Clavibacter michiganensis]|uniref:hypothetical protein n=1 Tax=Clavibacter michiganensis TaxID=28447 RepID=UPI000CE796E7|nr:hypothetical protein [Clavibacter michiganensis]PPF53717.1 hypothetical protein C5B94_09335 [Clavibacter michiganensis]